MISASYITEWAAEHPWRANEQVEQDLLLSRALVALFSDPFLCEALAFRGGTALHKLYFSPQIRYSEDIDLVQVHPAPFGEIFDRMKKVLDFLPNMKRVQKAFNNSLRFKTESTIPPIAPIKIKVETNCKEHFSELGYRKTPFSVENGWYSGSCQINTFALEELIGTKVRALFQRKKGRDLFDLHFAFSHSNVDRKTVMRCFERYMRFSTGMVPTPRQFDENMAVKLAMPEFREDTANYLRPGIIFEPDESWEFVRGWLFEGA
jgi:predicted nucleotidyltransferase component of viral defense system